MSGEVWQMGGAGAAQPGSTNRPGDAQAKVRRGFRSRLTAFQFFAIVGAAWVAYLLAMMAWGGLNLLLLLAAAVVGGGAPFAAYRLDLRHRVNPDQVATAEVLTFPIRRRSRS